MHHKVSGNDKIETQYNDVIRFTAFYDGQHSGRKLNWLYKMSKGDLVTNCFKNKYTLQVRDVVMV